MRILSPLCMSLLFGMMLGLSAPSWGQPWQDVAGDLMSPACPGRTLLNCTSSQAEQWRELIRQKLAQGESKEQILRYFVDIGGEGILAAPPKQGFALTAWLLPLFSAFNKTCINAFMFLFFFNFFISSKMAPRLSDFISKS